MKTEVSKPSFCGVEDVPIEPYFDDGQLVIYHADCEEVLPHLPMFDLLLTDPPYGIGQKWSQGGKMRFASCGGNLWDGSQRWDDATAEQAVFSAINKCSKSIVWGGNYYPLPPSRGYLIWDKMQTGFSLADSEYAWCSWPTTPRTFRFARAQLATEGKRHPTQKPLGLMRFCINQCGDAETILDPFMGSGTTLVAAKLEGRKAVGIESSEKYCEIAAKRLEQGVLF